MNQAIGDLLPLAMAVALSPIPIIAVVVMLGTPRARSNGPAFAVGWVLGLTAACTLVVVLAGDADDPESGVATGVNWVQVGVGLLFLVMALRQWKKRPRQGEAPVMPPWMSSVDHFGPGRSLVLGVALSAANPKNLALTAAGAAAIARAGLSTGDSAIAVAVFVVVGSLSVAGAVLAFVLAGERASGPLQAVQDFMTQHNAVIMMIVLLILGAKILGDGLGGLGR